MKRRKFFKRLAGHCIAPEAARAAADLQAPTLASEVIVFQKASQPGILTTRIMIHYMVANGDITRSQAADFLNETRASFCDRERRLFAGKEKR